MRVICVRIAVSMRKPVINVSMQACRQRRVFAICDSMLLCLHMQINIHGSHACEHPIDAWSMSAEESTCKCTCRHWQAHARVRVGLECTYAYKHQPTNLSNKQPTYQPTYQPFYAQTYIRTSVHACSTFVTKHYCT